jgi:hypothetical protein
MEDLKKILRWVNWELLTEEYGTIDSILENLDDLIEIFTGEEEEEEEMDMDELLEIDLVQIYVPEGAYELLWDEKYSILETQLKTIKGFEEIYQQDKNLFAIDIDENTKDILFYHNNKSTLMYEIAKIYFTLLGK